MKTIFVFTYSVSIDTMVCPFVSPNNPDDQGPDIFSGAGFGINRYFYMGRYAVITHSKKLTHKKVEEIRHKLENKSAKGEFVLPFLSPEQPCTCANFDHWAKCVTCNLNFCTKCDQRHIGHEIVEPTPMDYCRDCGQYFVPGSPASRHHDGHCVFPHYEVRHRTKYWEGETL